MSSQVVCSCHLTRDLLLQIRFYSYLVVCEELLAQDVVLVGQLSVIVVFGLVLCGDFLVSFIVKVNWKDSLCFYYILEGFNVVCFDKPPCLTLDLLV